MALERQNLSINFAKGIDTKTDDKQVVTGKLLRLENCTFQSTGRFKKRNGYGVLSSVLSTGNAIVSYNSELVALDGSAVYSYGAQYSDLTVRGKKIACDIAVDSIVRNSTEQTNPDSAILNGIMLFAYEDSSGQSFYTVLDAVTKKVYKTGAIGVTATNVKVTTFGNAFIVSYVETTAGLPGIVDVLSIDSTTLSTTSGSVGALNVLTSGYDVCVIGSNLVYGFGGLDNTGHIRLVIQVVTSALTLGANFTYFATPLATCVFPGPSGTTIIGFSNAINTIEYIVLNAGFTAISSSSVVVDNNAFQSRNVTGLTNSSGPLFFYELLDVGDSNSDAYIKSCQVTGSTPGTPAVAVRSVGLWSKPFVYGGNTYLVVTHESKLQSCYFVIDSTGHIITRIASENGGGLSTSGTLREVNKPSSNQIQFAYLIKDFVTSINGDVYTQTGVNSLSLTFGGPIEAQEIGGNLNLTGGVVSMYDGSQVVEKNFHLYPEGDSVTVAPLGGGLQTGQYQYCEVYEWTDNQGQIHQSAQSIPTTLNTGINRLYGNVASVSGSALSPVSGANWNYVSVGALISGSGIPANTYIVDGTRNINTSPSSTTTALTITPGKGFNYSASQGSPDVTLSPVGNGLIFGSTTAGSNVLVMNQSCDLFTQGFIQYYNGSGTSVVTVTAINGLNVAVSSAFTVTVTNGVFNFIAPFSGTVVNGNNALTLSGIGVISPSPVGRTELGTGKLITGYSHPTVFMDSNYSYTGAAGCTPSTAQTPPSVGETYTDLAGCFSGTVTVKKVVGNVVTLNAQATVSSSVSYGSTMVTASAQSATVTVPTLRLTEKPGVSIAIYRTPVNQSVFYRVSPLSDLIINDKTVDYIEFIDTTPDSILIGNEQLYTTGDVVDNFAPPPCSITWTYKNRSIIVPNENSRTFWYSKPAIPGVAVEFSDQFVENVPYEGGGITGGGQLDDKNIIFKRSSIFVQVGDGPANTGFQNDFSDPQKIASDSGCINQKSIVLIPSGLMYQSEKGIYLLDRSLNVTYIGHDVEKYNNAVITSSKLISTLNQVRYSLAGSSTTLVYDYMVNEWSVFTNPEVADATIYNDIYTYIAPSGKIYKETIGTFLDDAAAVLMNITTSWLSLAGFQAFQRVYKVLLIGEYKSPHSIVISVANDFNPTYTQSITVPVSSAPIGQYQYRLQIAQQKCESIQINLSEQQTAPYGEGASLSAMGLEVGAKKGLNKITSLRTYG